jgi:hypothetical protein
LPRFAKNHGPKTPDQWLAHHLEQAENHLISAVELFAKMNKPNRSELYLKRLIKTQETITALYREELVRIRGPFRPSRGKKAA